MAPGVEHLTAAASVAGTLAAAGSMAAASVAVDSTAVAADTVAAVTGKSKQNERSSKKPVCFGRRAFLLRYG